jgi:EAL domain-containing protein (putative c-di-GMP-specific phosphodiesterase class I)
VNSNDYGPVGDVIAHLLRTVRRHLDLDVAFISEFTGGMRVFRYLDSATGTGLEVGTGHPIEETYCENVAAGRLELVVDAAADSRLANMAVTAQLGIRTYAGVPIRFSDGHTYGTLCCYSRHTHPELGARDIMSLRMVADVVSHYLEADAAGHRRLTAMHEQVCDAMADRDRMWFVYQPIRDLADMRIVEVEALARFENTTPTEMFGFAAATGLGTELETYAVHRALEALGALEANVALSVNVSPATLTEPQFREVVADVPAGRLTVEVTEHVAVESYDELVTARRWLHDHGIALAIDDVGMGFSGLNHILKTQPDKLKIDRAVVSGVDSDPAKQAMVEALCRFADRTKMAVVAEGIETDEELSELRRLDVKLGQGYLLGRPAPLPAVEDRDQLTGQPA